MYYLYLLNKLKICFQFESHKNIRKSKISRKFFVSPVKTKVQVRGFVNEPTIWVSIETRIRTPPSPGKSWTPSGKCWALSALTEKMHCREQFSRTASEYSAIVWLTPYMADQFSWNVCEMFTFHMQNRSAANTLS